MSNILPLALTAALPAAAVAVLLRCEGRKGAPTGLAWQALCGIVFGVLAVLGTELGIEADGAIVNVRDAAPLCAGLIFGGPAGIISGVIGGAERALAVVWGAGAYTQVACSIATVFAGVFGALLRRYIFDGRVPAWYFGLLSGFFVEVVDMLLIILTHMSDVARAFYFVQICAIPMICMNGVSVMAALAVAALLRGEGRFDRGARGLGQMFQGWLACVILGAFLLTTGFTALLQTRLSRESARSLLSFNLASVENQAQENLSASMLIAASACRNAVENVPEENLGRVFDRLLWQYDAAEINIIDHNGIITASTNPDYDGYDMYSGEQSAEFMNALKAGAWVVEDPKATTYDPDVVRGYAGMGLEGREFIQVGFAEDQLARQWAEQVRTTLRDWPVGEHGFIIIADRQGEVVSDGGRGAATLAEAGVSIPPGAAAGELFQSEVFGDSSYCMYDTFNNYMLIATLPLSEAYLARDMSVYLTVFTEIVIFVLLFVVVACLVRYLVVSNVRRVNKQLDRITAGDLETFVDVRPNLEFASLSDGINSTVDTLKEYIAEAETRIDKELKMAKDIQMSALTRVFPERDEFSLYAYLRTAKEVGGDFYDFYMLGEDRLAILIADVSGKGIPAALFMMSAKSTIKSLAENGLGVAEVLTRANQELCEHNEAQMFVTAWLGVVDLKTGEVEYANAGHNAPLVHFPGQGYQYLRGGRRGLVLGGMEGVRYRTNALQLERGAQIFLYTDGITEAVDGDEEMYGEERLEAVLNRLADDGVRSQCEGVVASVDAFAGDEPQFDDLTTLAFELAPAEEETMEEVEVRPELAEVETLLALTQKTLEAQGVEPRVAMQMEIVVDEVFSNIVRYSGAARAVFAVGVSESEIRMTFRDDGVPYDPTDAPEPDVTLGSEERTPGGLGAFVTRKIMDAVIYEHRGGENTLTLTKKRAGAGNHDRN